jgi:hypothetical protein
MKRATLVFGVLSVLLFADGLYMELTNYQPGDQNAFFGNPRFILSDGATVLIAAGMLLVVTVVMWVVSVRRHAHAQPEDESARQLGSHRSASKA